MFVPLDIFVLVTFSLFARCLGSWHRRMTNELAWDNQCSDLQTFISRQDGLLQAQVTQLGFKRCVVSVGFCRMLDFKVPRRIILPCQLSGYSKSDTSASVVVLCICECVTCINHVSTVSVFGMTNCLSPLLNICSSQVVPTVLPGGTVWDMRRSRLLIGVEQLALQGINFENQDQLSNNQWQDVAGNAFPAQFCLFICFFNVHHLSTEIIDN